MKFAGKLFRRQRFRVGRLKTPEGFGHHAWTFPHAAQLYNPAAALPPS
jgi:hypothetical protein